MESIALSAASGLMQQCRFVGKHSARGKISGANSSVGHLLRDPAILAQEPSETIYTETVIIGGGVSGLAAARRLRQNDHPDFLLLELDKETGGNAASGKNEISTYPMGAHYIPLPNNNLKEYLLFLEECNVITGYENNLPVINELYLCFDPQERLYINGYWQEGIIPHFGVPDDELLQVKKFLAAMDVFRLAKGADGRDAFSIPVDASSIDEQFRQLDTISMKEWMQQQGYTSSFLHWYINYCCRDDFGTDYHFASAWAGIHYFAGRKGMAANAPLQSVITWPQGNGWLVNELKKNIEKNILTHTLALHIDADGDGVKVKIMDTNTQKIKSIRAKRCIVATPQFITSRLLPADEQRKKLVAGYFVYQPWMVANISTGKLQERSGAVLSWDNVLYKGRGLGYVEATHQLVKQEAKRNVLTYYLPLTDKTAAEERTQGQKRSFEEWVAIIRNDLIAAHPDFDHTVENIEVWIWGHGMISPQKNFIHGPVKKQLQQPVSGKIFFAHTDLSGISNFEEAFYQGIKASDALLKTL